MDPPTGRTCFNVRRKAFQSYHENGYAGIRWPPSYMNEQKHNRLRPRSSVWDAEYFDFLGDCRPPPAFVGEKWSEKDVFSQLVFLIETSWSLIGKSDPDVVYFKTVPKREPLEERWNTLLNLDEALRQLMRDWWIVPSSHQFYQAILSRYPPLDMTKRWMDVYHVAIHRFEALRADIDDEMKEKRGTLTRKQILQQRPTSLMHFPRELVDMVISFCEPFVWDERSFNDRHTKFGLPHRDGTNAIKALRLTCRAISQRASLYLVREVRVALTSDSLARLEQISQHSLIRHGVRSIRLDLSSMSLQAARFPLTYVDRVRDHLGCRHDRELWPQDNLPDYQLSYNAKSMSTAWRDACDRVQKKIREESGGIDPETTHWIKGNEEVWEMLRREMPLETRGERHDWEKFDDEDEPEGFYDWDGEIDPKIVAESDADALRRGFDLYQQRFQDHLATRRRFCDEVSQAMSRMPRATRLEITDGMCLWAQEEDFHWVVPVPPNWDLQSGSNWGEPREDYERPFGPSKKATAKIREESIEKAFNDRWQWDQLTYPRLRPEDESEQVASLMGILLRLPGALESRGVHLTRLDIKISLPATGGIPDGVWHGGLLDDLSPMAKTVNLFKNLRYMEFAFRRTIIQYYEAGEPTEDGRWKLLAPLAALLSQAASSPALEFLKIYMPAFESNFEEEAEDPSKPDVNWLKSALFESQGDEPRWKELQHLELQETTLGEVELRRLLDSSPKLTFVSLNRVRLIEGSWYQVLEDLREWRQLQLQANVDPEVRLNRLMNSDLPSDGSPDLVQIRLWGRMMHYVSSLSGKPLPNPLRKGGHNSTEV